MRRPRGGNMRAIEKEFIQLGSLKAAGALPATSCERYEYLKKKCKFYKDLDMQRGYYKRTGYMLNMLKLVTIARQMNEQGLKITAKTLSENACVPAEIVFPVFQFVLEEL